MVPKNIPPGSDHARHWSLDPSICFLNHGSFGACPTAVLDRQAELRAEMERNTMNFFLRRLPELGEEALAATAGLLGADPAGIAFVNNASTGVNSMLRSMELSPGDEILVLNQGYAACTNAARWVAERAGARIVSAEVPFPLASADEAVAAVLDVVTDRCVLAVLDHITSPTGVVMPLDRLVPALRERGVESLVDGAHVPGQMPLNLDALGAAYYTGNFHKWLCTPKVSAFLHVREDKRAGVRPTVISHGAYKPLEKRFRAEFDWPGTFDPTPWACIPVAIETLASLEPGGLEGLYSRNRSLTLSARRMLCDALGTSPATPDDRIAMLAAVRLPDASPGSHRDHHMDVPPLQQALWDEYRIEVPIIHWPKAGKRWLRISCAAYNSFEQYEYLAHALTRLL